MEECYYKTGIWDTTRRRGSAAGAGLSQKQCYAMNAVYNMDTHVTERPSAEDGRMRPVPRVRPDAVTPSRE